MSQNWPAIQAVATKILATKLPGQTDLSRYGYDRAQRVQRAIDKLVPAVGERIDRADLAKIAVFFVGVAQNVAGPGKTPDDQAYGDAAELASDQLKDLLPHHDLDTMLNILQEHRKRDTGVPEARLLSDAVALEEFGLVGFWNQNRQFHAAGKSLEQLLKLWKAQHDYSYWESRLRDGFHYEAARRTAKDRLANMKDLYERLQREHNGEDVAGHLLGHF
jgi:hypothetical protein